MTSFVSVASSRPRSTSRRSWLNSAGTCLALTTWKTCLVCCCRITLTLQHCGGASSSCYSLPLRLGIRGSTPPSFKLPPPCVGPNVSAMPAGWFWVFVRSPDTGNPREAIEPTRPSKRAGRTARSWPRHDTDVPRISREAAKTQRRQQGMSFRIERTIHRVDYESRELRVLAPSREFFPGSFFRREAPPAGASG